MAATLEEEFETGDTRLSALLQRPNEPRALLVLGHGAGADMRHAHMQSLASALFERGIATFRFNFPFRQAGRNRTDSLPVCLETIEAAVRAAMAHRIDAPLCLGGHSFGGRMASHYMAQAPLDTIRTLVWFSFPLHPAKRPDTERADHLGAITVPQLFISGTRDALAERELLSGVVARLPHATLHELDTADHGFRILKRSRTSTEDVYAEAARVAAAFIASASK